MTRGKRLILFDVDGTLLSCGRQIRPIFRSAMVDAFGTAGDMEGYDFAGKTDDRIVTELLAGAGLSPTRIAAGIATARRLYLERLERDLDARRMRLLPAVVETLERLAAREGVALGLLTGNWEEGARIKLGRFDLNRFFAFGAFGDGVTDRAHLPPLALERAARIHGGSFLPEETLIVGDTSLDVDCGRRHGIAVLGVATGGTSADALRAAGADWVITDLRTAGAQLPAAFA